MLDRIFSAWFAEATDRYGWTFDAAPAPKHTWDWNAKPQSDPEKTANARKTSLGCGVTSLGRVYAEDGLDFEDEIVAMATEYGVSTEEMRAKLMDSVFANGSPPASQTSPPKPGAGQDAAPTKAAFSHRNGNGHASMILGS